MENLFSDKSMESLVTKVALRNKEIEDGIAAKAQELYVRIMDMFNKQIDQVAELKSEFVVSVYIDPIARSIDKVNEYINTTLFLDPAEYKEAHLRKLSEMFRCRKIYKDTPKPTLYIYLTI
ncbi:MAG: hypothetical protein N2749_03515 [Clostridia bacterium]|nr:hypothetical protein [Clostridia bacterium]